MKYKGNISDESENLLKHENCRWTFACLKLAVETLIVKHLSSSSLRMLLEKVIKKKL